MKKLLSMLLVLVMLCSILPVSALAEGSTITEVQVSSEGPIACKGCQMQFSAAVTGTGDVSQEVSWSVAGGVSGTFIDSTGKLTVAADETAATLTVTATSVADDTKSGSATVTVQEFYIDSVEVTSTAPAVGQSRTQEFTATVSGGGTFSREVTWELAGAVSSGTTLSEGGVLTVAADETAAALTVKATSKADTTKFGSATVTVVPTYTVTVTNGTANPERAAAGETVYINAPTPAGRVFHSWVGTPVEFTTGSAAFTMPAFAVELTAQFDVASPVDLTWDGYTAKWSPVENVAGYLVQLYKRTPNPDNPNYYDEIGDEISLTEVSHNFTELIETYGPGQYRFRVKSVVFENENPLYSLQAGSDPLEYEYIMTEKCEEVTQGIDASFKSNAPFFRFLRVEIDNNVLDTEHYTAKEGSTEVTLKGAYTKTLSVGEHSISIVSGMSAAAEYKVTATFLVAAPAASIAVTPETATVEQGKTQQFAATVLNLDDKTVTWSVSGASGSGTGIDSNGLLTVGKDEMSAALTVKAVANGAVGKELSDTAVVTVKKTAYTVKFDSMGGSAVASQDKYYNDKADKPTAPTKTGCTFKAWYTDKECKTEYDFAAAITGDITLYAGWTANQYTVTFDVNGGKALVAADKTKTVIYGDKYGTMPTPGHGTLYFAGWYTAKTGGTRVHSTTAVSTAGDHTLYAHWSSVPVTGDDTSVAQVAGLVGALTLSLAGLTAVLVSGKRKKE